MGNGGYFRSPIAAFSAGQFPHGGRDSVYLRSSKSIGQALSVERQRRGRHSTLRGWASLAGLTVLLPNSQFRCDIFRLQPQSPLPRLRLHARRFA